jgi:hypothetical protein
MIHREHRGTVVIVRMEHGGQCRRFEFSPLSTNSMSFNRLQPAPLFSPARARHSQRALTFSRDERRTSVLESFIPALAKAFESLFTYPKPIVAAVNGTPSPEAVS